MLKSLNQKGVVQIFFILLLLAGIIAGVYLVQKTQIFKPKAYNTPVMEKLITIPRGLIDTETSGTSPQWFSLSSPTGSSKVEPTEGVKLAVADILGSQTNSGWLYLASVIPDQNGITFWFSITKIHENTALLYGVTDTTSNQYYSGFILGGTIQTSDQQEYMISYSFNGKQLVKVYQEKHSDGILNTGLGLEINLPWPSTQDSQRRYIQMQHLPWNGDIIWESGDGVIPMAEDLLSWYISFTFDKRIWMDVQKFNLPTSTSQISKAINHRWGSFILTQDAGELPAGTQGVWWEILDDQNSRRGEGFTNFDLKQPGSLGFQQTKNDFRIIPLEIFDSGNKKYLRKYKLIQEDLGIDLVMETIIPNQENAVTGRYFYEGVVKVFNTSDEEVGFGMLEQTHNEE